jgi:hypothetical protein
MLYRVARVRKVVTLEFYMVEDESAEEAVHANLESVHEVELSNTSSRPHPGVVAVDGIKGTVDDGQGNVMSIDDWDFYVERQLGYSGRH